MTKKAKPSKALRRRVSASSAGYLPSLFTAEASSGDVAERRHGCDNNRLTCLDLFCGAGGVAMGLHRAGFDVSGVDIMPQPRFPFKFTQGDALAADLEGFDFVWASPPCQAHSALKSLSTKQHECFIERTREKLIAWGGPWIVENVPGAPLRNPVMLCGSALGVNVRRHRIFESNLFLMGTECEHWRQPEPLSVTGHFDGYGKGSRKALKPRNLAEAREAMGIDWMSAKEIVLAIPPAYSEFLARQVLSLLPARAGLAATLTRDVRATPTPSTTAQADNVAHQPPNELERTHDGDKN